jgi:glycosyltransferase involved in cell wall biosynthesis
MMQCSDSSDREPEHVTLSVIAPCYNEEPNIDLLVERTLAVFSALDIRAELVLIDDGSVDRTWARVCARTEADPRVRGLQHSTNGGIEAAWHTGLTAARGRLICLIDADLQNRPEDIPHLLRAYVHGPADVVQGVRHASSLVTRHRLFTRGLNRLLNRAFGTSLRDNKSGFILCHREVLRTVLEHRFYYKYFQSFLGVAVCTRGYTIAEVDTVFDARHAGSSFLSRFPILASIRICWELLKFRLETCLMTKTVPRPQRPTWLQPDFLSTTLPAKP